MMRVATTTRNFCFFLLVCFFFFALSDAQAPTTQCAADLKAAWDPKGNYHNESALVVAASGTGLGDWGDYELCQSLVDTQWCLLYTTDKFPISPTYNLTCNPIVSFCTVGVCAPSTCPEQNLTDILHNNFYLKSLNFTVQCAGDYEWIWSNYFAVVLLCFLGVLSIIGMIWDYYDSGTLFTFALCFRRGDEPIVPISADEIPVEIAINEADHSKNLLREHGEHPPRHHERSKAVETIGKFFKAFSFTQNFSRLLTPIPGDFGSLNGLRVISMLWIILGHTFDFLSEVGVKNIETVKTLLDTWTFTAIINTPLSVDTFFFISGFLLGFFVLREMYAKGKMNFFLFYFHRFWRLLPLYSFLILMYTNLIPIVANGPIWSRLREHISAHNPYCWTNILFINNFYPSYDYQCMNWSWFLADDMQFYVISPLFWLSYYYNKLAGWLILLVFMIASWTANAVTYYRCDDCGPSLLGESAADQFDDIYIRPYTRIPPFLIGLAGAYLLHYFKDNNSTTKNKYVRIRLPILVAGYIFAFFLLLSTVYGTYHSGTWDIHGPRAMIYDIFSRTAWTVGVCILVLFMSMGYGGVINTILASSFWDPFAKLTYAAYLIHPMIIRTYYYSQLQLPGWTYLEFSWWYIGVVVISYTLAVFAYCLVEKAFMNLESLILPKRGH